MTGEILFLAHRMPFPPDRGDKIRSHHILRALARLAPVHVATFADDDRDMGEEAELAAAARSYILQRRTKPLALAGIEALVRGIPVSLAAWRDPQVDHYVRAVLRDHPITSIYVFSGQMGQYVPNDFAGRLIVDFVDVDSAKFDAYAAMHRGPRAWIDRREAAMLRAEEQRLAARADLSLLISRPEAALFRARLDPQLRAVSDVRVLANGIDSHAFDPAVVEPDPQLVASPGPRIVFTGQMDYAPNVAAAQRVITRLLPAIRAVLPAATFHVVGRNPAPELAAHDGRGGVRVWGAVTDMRGWLRGADLALVPLELARGVQNKVLEAMAMAVPVVLTSAAATGIDAADDVQFAVADSDADLVASCLALLADPARSAAMGAEARSFVADSMSWPAALAPLPAMIEPARHVVRSAA